MRREHYKKESGGLPAGYLQLKSIGCTGTCGTNYIEMDFKPIYSYTVRCEMQPFSNVGTGTSGTWICGVKTDTGNIRQCMVSFFKTSTNTAVVDVVFGSYLGGPSVTFSGAVQDTVYSIECNKNHTTVNGVTKTHTTYGTNTPNSNFVLFRGEGNSVNYTNRHKLFWLSLSDSSDNLIHYFVPAMRESDSKLGVYDTVTDKFYPVTGNNWNYELI